MRGVVEIGCHGFAAAGWRENSGCAGWDGLGEHPWTTLGETQWTSLAAHRWTSDGRWVAMERGPRGDEFPALLGCAR